MVSRSLSSSCTELTTDLDEGYSLDLDEGLLNMKVDVIRVVLVRTTFPNPSVSRHQYPKLFGSLPCTTSGLTFGAYRCPFRLTSLPVLHAMGFFTLCPYDKWIGS